MAQMPSQNNKNARQLSTKNPYLAERVEIFSYSVWEEIESLAQQYDCISLLGGIPDYEAPKKLKDAAKKAIDEDFNQYCFKGANSLLKAIAEKVRWFNGINADPETDIIVCCGSGEALTVSMHAILNPGDKIVLFEPFFASYLPMARITGAKPLFVTLHTPKCHLDPEQLKNAFASRPKAILVNSPHNPFGKVFSREELQLIADLCEDYNVICLTDEVYEHFVYDDLKHISIATLGSMEERTITISGFSKVFGCTGWRVGYTVANKTISKAVQDLHELFTVSGPHPLQIAIAEVLQELSASYYEELANTFAHKRDLLFKTLTNAGFACLKPNGAFYIVADVKRMGFNDNIEFVKQLIKTTQIACFPLIRFYMSKELDKRFVRFTFSKKDETLQEVEKRLENIEFPKNNRWE